MPASRGALRASEIWAERLADAIGGMTGTLPTVRVVTGVSGKSIEESGLWWRQQFQVSPDVSLAVGGDDATVLAIGRHILQSAAIDDPDDAAARETWEEVLSQSLSGAAHKFSFLAGREIACARLERAVQPAAITATVELSAAEATYRFLVSVPAALETLIAPLVPAALEGARGVALQQDTAAVPVPLAPPSLDVLLDVELPVSVSFGRAQLPLKDVVKLMTGSIIELNRTVSEPVEIIVNNCVIAKGEVVVVEGNFGVRIRQVVSRQERLRTLR